MNQSKIVTLEPLTHDEERERLHLERKVERAFYEAGMALMELRDRKLYRSSHNTFAEYCKDRFGFTKRSAYYLIDTVEIVDNLQKSEPLVHIMPTSERQCRPLKSLNPSQQKEAWVKSVKLAKGKVPSSKIVKEVVNQIKGCSPTKQIGEQAHNEPKIKYVPIENPQVGQKVRISHNHPLFPETLGTITQLPNRRSAVVELENQQRELIDLFDLEFQRLVDGNSKVSSPTEGVNRIPGVGLEYYVRLDEATWNELNDYAEKTDAVTLGSAIARLLDSVG